MDKKMEIMLEKVQDVISKLKFLSKIKKGELLQVNGLSVVGNNWYERFIRHYNSSTSLDGEIKKIESREISLNFIKEVCEDALKLVKHVSDISIIEKESREKESRNENIKASSPSSTFKPEYYEDLRVMLIKSLKECQPGIQNLMASYEDDKVYTAKVETFISLLNVRIDNLVVCNNDPETM